MDLFYNPQQICPHLDLQQDALLLGNASNASHNDRWPCCHTNICSNFPGSHLPNGATIPGAYDEIARSVLPIHPVLHACWHWVTEFPKLTNSLCCANVLTIGLVLGLHCLHQNPLVPCCLSFIGAILSFNIKPSHFRSAFDKRSK